MKKKIFFVFFRVLNTKKALFCMKTKSRFSKTLLICAPFRYFIGIPLPLPSPLLWFFLTVPRRALSLFYNESVAEEKRYNQRWKDPSEKPYHSFSGSSKANSALHETGGMLFATFRKHRDAEWLDMKSNLCPNESRGDVVLTLIVKLKKHQT